MRANSLWPSGMAAVWRSRSLRWGVAVAAVLGFSLLAMFGLMYWRSSVLLFDTLDRSVSEQLELLSARPPDMLPFMISSRMNQGPEVVTRVGLFSAGSQPIVGDIAAIPPKLVLNGAVQAVLAAGLPLEHWRAAGRVLPDGRIIVVARDADEILAVRENLVRGAAVGIIPAILLSLGAGATLGLATERRLRRLNAVAERIVEGNLGERLPARLQGDELDHLCAIVNRTLDRLEEGVGALRGVGENIAHDIRTPLTALRSRLERGLVLAEQDEGLSLVLQQSIGNVDQTLSIVTALLRIAEIEHVRRTAAFAAVDLAEIVQETTEAYRPVAEDRGIELALSITTPACGVGDRQLLIEALVNLVDNAVKFTPPGGSVTVALSGTPHRPEISVSDNGPGIPVELRSAVFQRFYRADTARSARGSGLGLSLVAAVAKLHRFAVEVGDNDPGCRITLRCWPDDTAIR